MNEVMQREEQISTADLITKHPADAEAARPLLAPDFVSDLRSRWDQIQTSRTGGLRYQAPYGKLRRREGEPGTAMGPWRRSKYRGPACRFEKVPVLLSEAFVRITKT